MVTVLAGIRSLHNVGSIFRTADAAGIEKLYLCGITPTPFDRFGKPRGQLTKVSLGAEKSVAWEYHASILRVITQLKKDGYKIYAIEQSKRSISYDKLRTLKRDKIALVLGSEVRGLSGSVLKRCDRILEIPMRGKKESLNVAVAFGIVAFHLNSHRV